MPEIDLDSDLLDYLIQRGFQPGDRLPTISELQSPEQLGISISKVREQLEVARALGIVEVRSKTGMRMKPYSFTPAVHLSLFFALAQDLHAFELFGELRNHVEAAFLEEAGRKLLDEDKAALRACIEAARAKLNGHRNGGHIRIPNEEHRSFHLTIFKRLENPFVMGILEAYWDAYNAVELSRYTDYDYLQQVWAYHERILDALCKGDYDSAREIFVEHTRLIRYQPGMQNIARAAAQADETSK
jgi:DNA-binding FadR family transcriptional regulator